MDKIWLKSYPPGVPAEIDPTRYSSVAELLEEAFRDHRAKPAFVVHGQGDQLRRARRRCRASSLHGFSRRALPAARASRS